MNSLFSWTLTLLKFFKFSVSWGHSSSHSSSIICRVSPYPTFLLYVLCIFPTCHSLYDESNIPLTPPLTRLSPQFQIFVILIRPENTCLCVWMCVCASGFSGFIFCAFWGAGIVTLFWSRQRGNLPLHCTGNAHNVILERGRVWGRSTWDLAPTLDFDKHQCID